MMPRINNTSTTWKLENTKKEIRSLLISVGSHDITLPKLSNMYKKMLDSHIPFKEFNYTNLKDFLCSMPEVVSLRYNKKNELCVYHIDTEKSKHISCLIAKEKKKLSFNKPKIKTFYNCINPHLLNEILQELKTSTFRNKVSKAVVLSTIIDRIGLYSFYTMANLNNQLYELTHVLTHDEKYIYFKENFPTKDSKKTSMDNLQGTKLKIDYKNSKHINENSRKMNMVDVLIKNITKCRLQKLIEKHENGIWCSKLPSVYRHEYGLELEYTNLGFNSIVEFAAALPDIIKIIKPQNSKKQLLVNAKTSINDIQNYKLNTNNLQAMDDNKLSKNEETDIKPIPIKLSPEVSKTLIPQWAMNINETVEQIRVTSLFSDAEKYLDIIIAEVHSPSFFWILLRRNRKIINQLMSQLEQFYVQQDLDKYKIPEIVLQKGLHVACIYAEMWHRGIIKKIYKIKNEIIVHFFDYGTIKTYNIKEVYFLDRRFSTIPAQAIPCSLNNVKPLEEKKWPLEVTKEFVEKVYGKPFIACISSIDEQTNSMMINIIDINNQDNKVYINEWMIKNKLAEWRMSNDNKNNFTYSRYKKCVQNMKNKLSTTECKKKLSIDENKINGESFELMNNFTENYVTFDKKVKALKIYKEKFLNSSQISSLVVFHNTHNDIQEKKTDEKNCKVHKNLNDKQILHSQNSDLTKIDKKLIYRDNSNSRLNSDISYSSFTTGNFLNNNSNESSKKLSKYYNSKNKSSDRIISINFGNLISELETLKILTEHN